MPRLVISRRIAGETRSGPDLHYFKYFGQYFDYLSWQPHHRAGFKNRAIRWHWEPGSNRRESSRPDRAIQTEVDWSVVSIRIAGPLDAGGNPTAATVILNIDTQHSELCFPHTNFSMVWRFRFSRQRLSYVQEFCTVDVQLAYGFEPHAHGLFHSGVRL
jgi:hypothetical protein